MIDKLLSNLDHAQNDNEREAAKEAIRRLHAAAPELLSALKMILVQFGEYKDGDGAAKFHTINIARTAIAKTEGK